ncbi:MAG: DNA-3-methyladenine glycosylase I [Ghiorsea sp.]
MKFEVVYQRAVQHKGGETALENLLPVPRKPDVLFKVDERVFLAEMTRCVFQAGFSWKVIDHKWAGFEEVFHGFGVNEVLSLLPEDWGAIKEDKRIVRNGQKISSVRVNAQFIEEIAIEFGSFGQFLMDWPESDLVGLFALLKKRGSRLGGNSGQHFLRNVGKDTFVLTRDVVRCLQVSGLDIKANPTSKRDMTAVQNVFNQWHQESGFGYTHLSRIAAYSITE